MIIEKLEGFRFQDAVVGFGGEVTLWWMRFLKKNFYHCLVALKHENGWLLIDPLIHCLDIIWIKNGDIHSYFKRHGYQTLNVEIKEPENKLLRVAPFTCVETVKRIIGVQQRSIFTPYQLFCFLNKKMKSGT